MVRALLIVALPAVLTDATPKFVLPGDVADHTGKPVIVCGTGAEPTQAGNGRVTFMIAAYRGHRPSSVLVSIASRLGDDAGRYVARNVCATGIARRPGGSPYLEVASVDHVVDDPLLSGAVLSAPDVQSARPLRRPQPRLTGEQIRGAGGHGTIGVDLIVLPNGVPGEMRVVRSMKPAMDAEALAALRGWEFAPALRAGAPVPYLFYVEFTFNVTGKKN